MSYLDFYTVIWQGSIRFADIMPFFSHGEKKPASPLAAYSYPRSYEEA